MAFEENGAFIRNIAEVPWREFPDHFGGALSKPLVMPETAGSRHIDYRISMYQPMAHVARHKHQVRGPQPHPVLGKESSAKLAHRQCAAAFAGAAAPQGQAHASLGRDVPGSVQRQPADAAEGLGHCDREQRAGVRTVAADTGPATREQLKQAPVVAGAQ